MYISAIHAYGDSLRAGDIGLFRQYAEAYALKNRLGGFWSGGWPAIAGKHP